MSGHLCDHGLVFDEQEAKRILSNPTTDSITAPAEDKEIRRRLSAFLPLGAVDFVMGPPAHAEIRRRWPRLNGPCPKGCGFTGIAYASFDHYQYGDW